MELEALRQKALNTVEKDMKRYQEAQVGILEWEKRECMCGEVLHRWCSRCAYIDQYKSTISDLQNKYWHG